MTLRLAATGAALLATALAPQPARAQAMIDQCTAELCKASVTPSQLMREVQTLVNARRFAEARPMLAALATIPQYSFETRFLTAFVAEQTGDYAKAAGIFRDMLVADPGQTRVRLELGRTLLAMGKPQSADRQLRLVQEDGTLPPEIQRAVRSARDAIRSRRAWRFSFDVGFSPDSNINNATSSDTVTLMFGPLPIPLSLSSDARAKAGTGRTTNLDAGLRLPIAGTVSLVTDITGQGADYDGTQFDDYSGEIAIGPELRLSRATRLRIQGIGAERLYGGRVATRQWGAKLGLETSLTDTQRLGLALDARRTTASYDSGYGGWQLGAYASYERVVAKSFIASANLFVRRDALAATPYSDVEVGGGVGFGGELPWGFNVGVSAGVSRALFDAPLAIFSIDPRRDWRLNGRLAIGYRGLRVLGFSPSASLSYGRVDSTLDFYASRRTRLRFALARYF